MTFRARMMVGFGLVVLVPLAVFGLRVRAEMATRLTVEYGRRVQSLVGVIRADLDRQSAGIATRLDVLKDAIKAKPKEAGPYLQLAFIYAKYLRKTDQAVKYANQAIALDPLNFEAYQRLYDIGHKNKVARDFAILEDLDRPACQQ